MADADGIGFHPNVDRIMIVDSGVSVMDELKPRQRKSMQDYSMLSEPKIIITHGKELFATATGTI